MTRPTCAICFGPIPLALLSDKSVEAEVDYSRERHAKMRDFYCSTICFGVARDRECGSKGRSDSGRQGAEAKKARNEALLLTENDHKGESDVSASA